MSLAEEQIKASFVQSEKEVNDLHTRISGGYEKVKEMVLQLVYLKELS